MKANTPTPANASTHAEGSGTAAKATPRIEVPAGAL